jgi:DNA polymerase III epsilon subunit-like protein
MYLFLDTETTGLPLSWDAPASAVSNWPRLVQLAWELHDPGGRPLGAESHLVRPGGFSIPLTAEKIHGISTERAAREGRGLDEVLDAFAAAIEGARAVVSHNLRFDRNVVEAELHRRGRRSPFEGKTLVCTMLSSTEFCRLPGKRGFKWPTLAELHLALFGNALREAHDAAVDVSTCSKCFFELEKRGVIRVPFSAAPPHRPSPPPERS